MHNYLPYKVQCQSVVGTVNHCISVLPFSTGLGAALKRKKYSGIIVNLITVVYCTVYTFFHVANICSVYRQILLKIYV